MRQITRIVMVVGVFAVTTYGSITLIHSASSCENQCRQELTKCRRTCSRTVCSFTCDSVYDNCLSTCP
jgi:hypothetical protein